MPSDSITALIIEDEESTKDALVKLILKFCPEVELIGWAKNVDQAVDEIETKKPSLLFMDIQLGEQLSFEILEKVDTSTLDVIFTTAYDQFAVDAFRLSAVDYLLKPINPHQLVEAVSKVIKKKKENQAFRSLDVLLNNLSSDERRNKKIVLSTTDMMHIVEIDTIVKCQSSGNYTIFYFADKKDLLISRTLKEFDDQLSSQGFFRIHRSWLINASFIVGYDKREGGCVVMKDQSRLPVSPNKKEELLKLINKR